MRSRRPLYIKKMEQYLFYMFGLLIIISSSMVINSKNPIHSVLFLILAYINASGLFLLLGVEFLALIFLIVYVGAVAILFIFTVMMLNITATRVRESLIGLAPISGIIGLIFFIQTYGIVSLNKGITLNNKSIGLSYNAQVVEQAQQEAEVLTNLD